MRKGLLGVIVGVGLMIAQSAGAAEMVRYDKSANNVKPEQTVAQIQMDGSCKGPHCRPCARPCPPRHCHTKQCGPRKHHAKKHHHKHAVKQQGTTQRGHNDSIEEKKMSSDRNFPAARKTSYQGQSNNNDSSYVEEYIDEVGREHR